MTYSNLQGVAEKGFSSVTTVISPNFTYSIYHKPSQYLNLYFMTIFLESSAPLTYDSRMCFHVGDF